MEYDNDGETLKVWNIMYIVAKDEEVALDFTFALSDINYKKFISDSA